MRKWIGLALISAAITGDARAFCLYSCMPDRPDAQQRFETVVSEWRAKYVGAKNDFFREQMRAARGAALCGLTDGTVNGWIGAVEKITSTLAKDGAIFEVKLNDHLWFTAGPDALIIRKDNNVFVNVSKLGVGDRIRFSGSLVPATGTKVTDYKADCFRENSFTESGSMTDPEYWFRFTRVDPM